MTASTRRGPKDPFANRLKHILAVWMKGNGFVHEYLREKQITTYVDFIRVIEDLNLVNSLKTREGQADERVILESTAERLRGCLSFINHIQMDWGPINQDGPADITKYGADMFEGYYSMNIPFEAYDNQRAVEMKERKQLQAARIQAVASGGNGTGNLSSTTSAASGANPPANPPSSSSTLSAAANLRKTIKVDPASFPALKDDAQWHPFHRQMIALCTLFEMQDVLDPTYVPPAEKTELFETQQAFLITVLIKNVLTIKGQEIVDKYISTVDAQKAWSEIVLYYSGPGSIIRKYRIDELRRKINSPLDTDYQGVRLTSVISEWETQLAEYDVLRGITTSPSEKLTLLESFLTNVRQLKSITTMQTMVAALIQTTGMTSITSPLTPTATINLYKQQAEIIDNDRKLSAVTQRTRIVQELQIVSDIREAYATHGFRRVNVAQLLDNSLSNDEWYEVLLTRQRRCRISPPSPRDWKKLTREEKHIWSELSDEARFIILNESSQWGLMPITHKHCIVPLKPRDPPKMYDTRKIYSKPT